MDDAVARGRWGVLANVVAMNVFATGMAWTYVVVIVPPILADLGLGLRDWGTLWSGLSMGALLGALPAGGLGDRFGVRRVVAVGALVMAASLGLRGVAGSFGAVLAAMVLFGVTLTVVAANLPKALGEWFPLSELGMANGVALGGNGAGQGLAAYAAPLVLASVGGWRALTFGLGIAVGALALVWVAFVRDRAPAAASSGAFSLRELFAGIAAVLRIRDVWLLAGSYFFFLAGYLGVIAYLPTYLASVRGLAPEQAGGMLSLVLASYVVGSLTLPAYSDRLGLRRVVYVPGILLAGGMVFADSLAVGAPLAAVMVVWGVAAVARATIFGVAGRCPSMGSAG